MVMTPRSVTIRGADVVMTLPLAAQKRRMRSERPTSGRTAIIQALVEHLVGAVLAVGRTAAGTYQIRKEFKTRQRFNSGCIEWRFSHRKN